jgi:cell division protein ZapA
MNDLIPITITIADRSYRIKVSPEDEEPVRKTVKFINDKISEFKTTIAGKDMQDYVSMALIWLATQPLDTVTKTVMSDELREGFERIESLLDKGLASLPVVEA